MYMATNHANTSIEVENSESKVPLLSQVVVHL